MNAIAVGTTTTEFMSGLEALWKCKDATSPTSTLSAWVVPGRASRFSDAAAAPCEL